MSHHIDYHPSSEMLLNYAMGNLKEAESLIISSHIAYCPECKAEVAKYESIGGFYLKNHEELNVSKSLWNNLIERLDGVDQEDKTKTANYVDHKVKSTLTKDSIRIPSFLHHYLSNDDTDKWKSTINNVEVSQSRF